MNTDAIAAITNEMRQIEDEFQQLLIRYFFDVEKYDKAPDVDRANELSCRWDELKAKLDALKLEQFTCVEPDFGRPRCTSQCPFCKSV